MKQLGKALAMPRRLRMTMTPKLVAARNLALGLMGQWGLTQEAGWNFGFNNRRRHMGLCVYPHPGSGTPGRIELSRHLVEQNPEAEIRDTILHEIAHALAGVGKGHGPRWRLLCLVVGARPQRCGDANMPAGKWQARCPSCHRVYHRHRRPKYADGYYCPKPGCGQVKGTLKFASVSA